MAKRTQRKGKSTRQMRTIQNNRNVKPRRKDKFDNMPKDKK